MEPALKQRVVGAAVLVALAVIFLPMLVKGPAPASGISDVPLELPEAPQGEFETRELPLVTPAAPGRGVVGMEADADDAPAGEAASAASPASEGMLPATTAGGDYAVSFGRYATAADAERVVAALHDARLPGYQEATTDDGRTLYRVRIGPYATRPNAEAARLRAVQVRDDVGAKVLVLDADPAVPAQAAAPATTARAASRPAAPAGAKPAAASAPPVERPATARSADATPAAPARTTPAVATTRPTPRPAASQPASGKAAADKPAPNTPVGTGRPAAGTGFAVQLGAFANAAEATRLRDRARAAGMPAFVESVRTDKGVLSRVSVGPALTRAEADRLKAQVAARLGIADTLVRSHP